MLKTKLFITTILSLVLMSLTCVVFATNTNMNTNTNATGNTNNNGMSNAASDMGNTMVILLKQ